MFLYEFNALKVKKTLQISRALNENIQLISLNQLNENISELFIVCSHLIVRFNLTLILF